MARGKQYSVGEIDVDELELLPLTDPSATADLLEVEVNIAALIAVDATIYKLMPLREDRNSSVR
jgi:hypothetical protein